MSQKSYDDNPILYLVPTPIGNFEDITIRAINILSGVSVIFSEDTRETRKLLLKYNIETKLLSSHMHNESLAKLKIVEYLDSGSSVALVSDRGTPVISDPGYECASHAIKKGHKVVALPGATAFVPALITSNIKPYPFIFYGFLSSKSIKRRRELEELVKVSYTIIIYESPHRLFETLKMIRDILGNRYISVSREISKKFEEIYRGRVENVISEIKEARGEFVIIIEGNNDEKTFEKISVIQHVNMFIKEGLDEKEAIKKTAKERNEDKSDIYKEYHTRK